MTNTTSTIGADTKGGTGVSSITNAESAMRIVSFGFALVSILLFAIAETCFQAPYFGGAAIAFLGGMIALYTAVVVGAR